ncbi:hypothetical protein [Phormidium tenue]|uniref:Uncharacterized protein n=1 Tax=Phormidium tenue NIES-30 TaxID=549789 RepID=A0A1U7J927_9CYAN|nr:hypothetical protein [Phormidium tenue]MBD2230964.1 hypothetical protein [Phormidium tenue FACHB-1052]OKH50000.1 hypothetical protein NIES30_04630 [Phormidium tenue NIES-30]
MLNSPDSNATINSETKNPYGISSDRLDRIEALLATLAESQARTLAIVEENAAGLRETRAIADSNTRAVEAWRNRVKQVKVDTEEATGFTRADLGVRIEDNQGVGRARFDQLHEEHNQRFNTLMEEARADRQRADRKQELHTQRFYTLLDEARADRRRIDEALARGDRARARNESEHRAFRETVRAMLAEIARLSQRVAE